MANGQNARMVMPYTQRRGHSHAPVALGADQEPERATSRPGDAANRNIADNR